LLNPDYRDKLSAFSEENVEYLLVGAYALAALLETRKVIYSPHTADFEPHSGMISSP
jgi:hypothetical protein